MAAQDVYKRQHTHVQNMAAVKRHKYPTFCNRFHIFIILKIKQQRNLNLMNIQILPEQITQNYLMLFYLFTFHEKPTIQIFLNNIKTTLQK